MYIKRIFCERVKGEQVDITISKNQALQILSHAKTPLV